MTEEEEARAGAGGWLVNGGDEVWRGNEVR